jgi:hypothetical protein
MGGFAPHAPLFVFSKKINPKQTVSIATDPNQG